MWFYSFLRQSDRSLAHLKFGGHDFSEFSLLGLRVGARCGRAEQGLVMLELGSRVGIVDEG